MEPLSVRLLGVPEISLGKQQLAFQTRKVLALLIYLVMERGMHSRESLMTLLWPESPPQSAAASLRVTLSRLRQALQQAGDLLISEAGNVAFNSNHSVNLDLDLLHTAALEDKPPDVLEFILDIDRGEFLEGFSLPDTPTFENWISVQRETCLRWLETIYDRLSQHQLSIHDSTKAVETSSRWVTRGPLSEQAYRRLMAAQAMNGQRPAALLTYHQLQETLKKELGIQPGRETVLLANNIEQGRVGTERLASLSRIGRITSIDRQGSIKLPFVGRTEEHGRLVKAFYQIGREKARAVILIGAAGVGKTRLINAFKDWAVLEEPETEVWQGQAFETGGRLAFQPVVEALRIRLDQMNAPEDLLEDVWLAEMSQLMPELRARYPDLPLPLTGDANFVRSRLFEAIAVLGNQLAVRHPAVLILDDMQWADADTLDLVLYLTRRWSEMKAPILLLMTVRQEAYAADVDLREWLTRLERGTSLTRILLDSLNGAAVEELIAVLAGVKVGKAAISSFAAWLWAETRGLPFFIEALLQMFIEQGVLVSVDENQTINNFPTALEYVRSVARVPLPPGVREVIRARLEQHSKEAGALLLAAAVSGRACTFQRLCQIADLAETNAMEALEALLDGRLLAERPSDRRPYTLAHDYIREVVYTESREARRRVYHRRALLALEAAGDPPAECAYHALAALLDEPAFRYSVAAGSEAFSSYALQDALSHFDTAREVARRMQDRGEMVDIKSLERLYRQRGQVLELRQDDEAAAANYEEMRAEAVKHNSKILELSALVIQSHHHAHYTGVFNPLKSRDLAQEALVLARELGDKAAEANALWGLQVAELYSAGDAKRVVAYGQEALTLARELGLKELTGLVLNNFAWPFGARKELEQARAELSEAQAIWRELGNLQKLAEASRFMLIIHNMAGDHKSTLVDAPKLSELGASIGSRLDEAETMLWLAYVYIRQGRFSQALDCIEQYGIYAGSLGHSNEMHGHQYARILFYLAVGALKEAEGWADRLYSERNTVPPNFITYYFVQVARAKNACGKLEESQAILDELLATLPSDAVWSYTIIDIALAYGEMHLAMGRPENIFAGLDEQIGPYRKAGFGRLLADEYWLRGRAALALGRYDEARESLVKARDEAEAHEERFILWKILATLSEVEQASGQADLAEQLSDQAKDVVNDIAEYAGELRDVFLSQPAVVQLLGEN